MYMVPILWVLPYCAITRTKWPNVKLFCFFVSFFIKIRGVNRGPQRWECILHPRIQLCSCWVSVFPVGFLSANHLETAFWPACILSSFNVVIKLYLNIHALLHMHVCIVIYTVHCRVLTRGGGICLFSCRLLLCSLIYTQSANEVSIILYFCIICDSICNMIRRLYNMDVVVKTAGLCC